MRWALCWAWGHAQYWVRHFLTPGEPPGCVEGNSHPKQGMMQKKTKQNPKPPKPARECSSLCLEGIKTPQRGSSKTLNTVFPFTSVLYNLSHVTDPLPPTTDHILTLFCLLLSQRTLAPGLTSGKLLPIWGRFVECTARAHSPRQHRTAAGEQGRLEVTPGREASGLWGSQGSSSHTPGGN